jgi:hypothetical protein
MAAATTTPPKPAPPVVRMCPVTKKPLPDGAVKYLRAYLDERDVPQKAPYPVPVDADDHRTEHRKHQCPTYRNLNGGGRERCGELGWLAADEKQFCPKHGKQLENVEVRPSQVLAILREVRRLHGPSAVPWVFPAAALAVDAAVTAAGTGVEAGLAPLLAAGTYVVTKRTLTARAIEKKRLERGEQTGRRYRAIVNRSRLYGAYAVEVSGWGLALAVTDFPHTAGLVVAAAGLVRWAIGSVPWWNAADERRDRGEVKADAKAAGQAAEGVLPPDPVALRAVTTWETLIGCQAGPLAGTKLVEYTSLPNCQVRAAERTLLPNWSAKVVAVVAGSVNMRENRPFLLGRIAAAYGCTYADVSFHADEADLSIGWLRVQPDNVLAETKLWAGPSGTDWKRGVSRVGRFDDGKPMMYRWWTKLGAAHDLVGGSSGSGKSEFVAQLILTSLHSNGLVLDWVGDPQGGQSFGQLKDSVDWFARDIEEIKLMLLAALKEMYRRNDALSAANIKTWRPGLPDMPLLVITLDEVQGYISDPIILELVTKLTGQGRKCGIKMRLVTQIIAAYNLGGNTYIKDQVKTGQTFTFRSETDQAGRSAIEGDSPIDPTALPKTWGPNTCAAGDTTAGLCFVQGLHGRDVYGRTDFTGDDMGVWLVDEHGDPTVTPGVFGPEAQQESGVLWGDRRERARRLVEAGRDPASLLSGGKALELLEAAAVAQAVQQPVRAPQPGQAPLPDRAREKVLAAAVAVADGRGVVERGRLCTEVHGKVSDSARDHALGALIENGELRRIKNGLYEVPDLAARYAASLPTEAGA